MSDAAPPLTDTQLLALRRAAALRRPIRAAARVARGSAITILAIGVLGVPLLVFFPSWIGLVMVTGICTIGVFEYVGAQRMRRGEPSAASFLGRNQLVFLALIVGYCILQMVTFSPTSSVLLGAGQTGGEFSQLASIDPQLARQVQNLLPLATYGFYSLIIVLSIAAQGGLSLYYFTRRRRVEGFRHSTPEWVRRLFVELE